MNMSGNGSTERNGFEVVILWNGLMDASPSGSSNLPNSSEVPSSLATSGGSDLLEWTSYQIILTVVLTLMCLTTISANSVVLYLFYKSKKSLRSPSHILLANLAFSDLLVGILVIPILGTVTIADKYRWPFGSFMCTVSEYTHFSLCALSMMSMTGVAFERYIGVRFPLKHRFIMTKSRVFKMIALVWILALSLTSIPLTVWPDKQFIPSICPVNGNRSFLFFVSFAVYWIPMTFMIILYCSVFIYAQKPLKASALNRKDSNVPSTSSKSALPLNSNRQTSDGKRLLLAKLRQTTLSKKLALVLITMLVMFGPVFTAFLMNAFDSPLYSFQLLLVAGWIRYANSCVNPFLFALGVPGYKKEFYKVFLNQRRGSANQNDSLSTSFSESNWDENNEDSEDDGYETVQNEVSVIIDTSNDKEQVESSIVPAVPISEHSKHELSKPPIILAHRFCTYCGEQIDKNAHPGKNQPCYCIACFEKFASGSGQVIFTDAAIRFSKNRGGSSAGASTDLDFRKQLGATDVSKSVRDSVVSLRNRNGIDDTLMYEIQRFIQFLNERMSSKVVLTDNVKEDSVSLSVAKRDTKQKMQSNLLKVLHDPSNVESRRKPDSSSSKKLNEFRKSIMSPIVQRRTKLLENKRYDEIDWASIEELDDIIVKLNNAMNHFPNNS